MTTYNYTEDNNNVTVKVYTVKEAFTNGFAQRVLKLENDITIYINYNEDNVTIQEVKGK